MKTHERGPARRRSPRKRATPARRAAADFRRLAVSRGVELRPDEGDADSVTVPREAFDVVVEVLGEMAKGHAVTVVPLHEELTTQEAADLLNVSRPHVVQLLDEGKIPSRKVGAHRRVRSVDVLAYRQRDDKRRKQALDALTAESEKLGLGY